MVCMVMSYATEGVAVDVVVVVAWGNEAELVDLLSTYVMSKTSWGCNDATNT